MLFDPARKHYWIPSGPDPESSQTNLAQTQIMGNDQERGRNETEADKGAHQGWKV
jgi:hypothetical protein